MKNLSFLFYTLIFCIISLHGCGKKGEPSAPLTVTPEKIKNLTARPRGRTVILSWSIPRENTDGSPLRDLKGFKILRSAIDVDKECLECPKRFSLLYDIDYKSYMMNNPHATTITYTDRDLQVKHIYTYRVVSYNSAHQLSPDSNTQEVSWDLPPPPPKDLRAVLEDKSVILSWEEPLMLEDGTPLKGLVGYTLYRRLSGETYPLTPLNSELITTRACRDKSVEADRDTFYTVRAVRKIRETFIESDPSEEVSINTADRTPPRPPTGLLAIPTKTGIVLKWNENKESDLKGYNLYRRAEGETDLKRLNTTLLSTASYLDSSVADGKCYTYAVTAVDDSTHANESGFSEEITIRYHF